MVLSVRVEHTHPSQDLLKRIQSNFGCEGVEFKGDDEFAVQTKDGSFEVKPGEILMKFDSDGYIAQIEPTVEKLGLDKSKMSLEIGGMIELPYIVPLRLELKRGFLDLLDNENSVFWKKYGESVLHGLRQGISKSRALKDAVKSKLTKNVLKKDGVVMHCIYTWDMNVPELDDLGDYLINDRDFLGGDINFKGKIGDINLDVLCNLDYDSIAELQKLTPRKLSALGGIPLYFMVNYKIKVNGMNLSRLGDATRVVFDGLEDTFGDVCHDQGFSMASPSEKKSLKELDFLPGNLSKVNDMENLQNILTEIEKWTKGKA